MRVVGLGALAVGYRGCRVLACEAACLWMQAVDACIGGVPRTAYGADGTFAAHMFVGGGRSSEAKGRFWRVWNMDNLLICAGRAGGTLRSFR